MTTKGRWPDDPFEGLSLDDWAERATVHEPPAHVRVEQAERERLEADDREQRGGQRRRSNRRMRRLLFLGAFVLFAGAVAVADRGSPPETSPWSTADEPAFGFVSPSNGPRASRAESSEPLGEPADPEASGGSYGFLQTQRDGVSPVTYDPCRPIEIVVGGSTAPEGGEAAVTDAVATAAAITGLDIRITGGTDERPAVSRDPYQRTRYGDRWAPVLLAWSDEEEVPALAGDVAGFGGSVAVEQDDGHRTYVTGTVVLDGPDLETMQDLPGGDRIVTDVLLHELGHLIGLAHVDDEAELMYPAGQEDLHGYQQGDRSGLTRLGQGDCVELL